MFTTQDAIVGLIVVLCQIVTWILSNRNHNSSRRQYEHLLKQFDDCMEELSDERIKEEIEYQRSLIKRP